ncbi:hypothetical protein BASA81_014680 [Batrachochytrium salamandrivorans]|nr:hypothetical protein BASA81_014680 [Batrachochytrium salamandrivorans]
MAKSIGSLTGGTHAVNRIIHEATKSEVSNPFLWLTISLVDMPHWADAGCVNLLISEANKTTRNFLLRVHAEVVRAYHNAGDIDRGLAYAHMVRRMGQPCAY